MYQCKIIQFCIPQHCSVKSHTAVLDARLLNQWSALAVVFMSIERLSASNTCKSFKDLLHKRTNGLVASV